MKKKVKKIPKYYEGTAWADMNKNLRTGAIIDATGTAVTNAIGSIGKPVTAAGVISGGLSGAQTGAAIGGPMGAGIGFAGGALLSAIGNKASTDGMGNKIYSSGITRLLGIGKSDEEIRQQANREKNSILSVGQTQNLQADYYNENPTGSINIFAAEGGIMRQPVDALVSKGELIYNPVTKKLSQVPGSKGKPNKKDDVYARLYEGDVVISNSPTMLMANGKTPALNLIGMVDKYATGGTVKAREAIIKKVVNWLEANKTKPTNEPKYENGTKHVKYGGEDQFLKSLEEALFKPQTPEITGKNRRWIYHLSKAADAISDFAPLATAMFGNYDYERVSPRIARNYSIPVDYSVNDILTDNQRAHAINNYNISQMGGSTGAYLAAANQSAANLMKANAQTRIYQKNKQNELIAKNIAQLNDWERYANNQMWTADVATDQNQGMAQQMKDLAKKDGYEFYTGKKYDKWKLAMLEPMYRYGAPDEAYRQIYKRRIV